MVALVLITLSLWVMFFMVLMLFSGRKSKVQSRLASYVEGLPQSEAQEEAMQSFHDRVVGPALGVIYRFVEKISPKGMLARTESRLKQIGRTGPHAVQNWIALRVVLGVVLPTLIGLLSWRLGLEPDKAIALTLLPMALVQMVMSMFLIRSVQNRRDAIEKQLPDALDIITVSVAAGLSFDGAVERVVQKMDTILSSELAITLKEMRMGKMRRSALRDLSDRCQVPDLTTWVGAMIQADELGVGISNVLRIQSAQMREKRKQRAQEKSMKAPIKIMFPLVFFIFPTIFVVLLGPAAINIMLVLGK